MREITKAIGFIEDKLYEFDSFEEFEKAKGDAKSTSYFVPVGLREQLGKLTDYEVAEVEDDDLAEEHADFIKRWYKDVFQHGYKHGFEDAQKVKK